MKFSAVKHLKATDRHGKQIVMNIIEITNAKRIFKYSLCMHNKNFCYKLRGNFTHLKLNIKIYEIILGDTNILKV